MSEENENTNPDATGEESPAPKRRTSRRASTKDAVAATEHANAGEPGTDVVGDGEAAPQRARGRGRKAADAGDGESTPTDTAANDGAGESSSQGSEGSGAGESAGGERQPRSRNRSRSGNRNSNTEAEGDGEGSSERSSRTRQRDRRRGRGMGDDIEPEILEDDVLLPIGGILDVLDNYAFVRTSGYLPGPQDVYVSLGQVKKYNLRKGDAIVGSIKQPREGENFGRQKFNALVRVDSINGQTVEEAAARPDFSSLTPLYPQERLRLETEPGVLATRVIDVVAPVGKGQRGLIVAPPQSGKTAVLEQVAHAITENNPEVHLMVVLVDERPEEVTELQRSVRGEVIASTFDRPAEDHTMIAELAIERAKRLVELGQDVVVLLDSLTRLGRAYNLAAPAAGRVHSGGVDVAALYPAKKFFGAARKIENGGSLTVIATAQVETGSSVDAVIFEEFTSTANMELRLSRDLAAKRVYPAIDVHASGTRREELLMGEEEVAVTWKIRRAVAELDAQRAIELLTDKMKHAPTNVEFLAQAQRSDNFGA